MIITDLDEANRFISEFVEKTSDAFSIVEFSTLIITNPLTRTEFDALTVQMTNLKMRVSQLDEMVNKLSKELKELKRPKPIFFDNLKIEEAQVYFCFNFIKKI